MYMRVPWLLWRLFGRVFGVVIFFEILALTVPGLSRPKIASHLSCEADLPVVVVL